LFVASTIVTRIKTFLSGRRLLGVGALSTVLLAVAACGGTASDSVDAQGKGATWSEVKKDGVITVGTEGTYKPFSYHNAGTGDLTGFDVDVMNAVADKLGIRVKYQETQWDAIFAGLDAGRFDVIANQVSINPEREADYDFSTPYTVSPGVVVVTDDKDISSLKDLAGKTTAQSLTSNWYQVAKDNGANVQSVEGWAQAVTLLKQGRVDATVNDRLTFLDYQKTEQDPSLHVATETGDKAENAFAFRKGSGSLVDRFDQALEELRADGTLAEISRKYFGADVTR
jgi:L-cystine transport system substrate-binding protein